MVHGQRSDKYEGFFKRICFSLDGFRLDAFRLYQQQQSTVACEEYHRRRTAILGNNGCMPRRNQAALHYLIRGPE